MTTIDTSTEAVERLIEGVTPGPWRIKDCTTDGYRCINYYQEIWNDETDILVTTEVTRAHNDGGAKNMRFIAAARDLVPALLKERDEARAALAASQPADPVTNAGCRQQVAVKPLVWVDVGADCISADVYSVGPTYGHGPERFMLTRGTKIIRWCDQPEPLKAAAQSDYEGRILAALEPAHHVNETPKNDHDSVGMLATTPAAVAKALEDGGEV